MGSNAKLQIHCNTVPERILDGQPSFNLDLLRAVAVTLVLAQHLLNRFYFAKLGFDGPAIGTFGVLIFFVHTCLVLMYSMERSSLDGFPLALNFYIRRMFRIYPLSMLAVLTAVALHLDSGRHGVPGLSHVTHIKWDGLFPISCLFRIWQGPARSSTYCGPFPTKYKCTYSFQSCSCGSGVGGFRLGCCPYSGLSLLFWPSDISNCRGRTGMLSHCKG